MALNDVIAHIDQEISKLQQARALLVGGGTAVKVGRGRPKGSKNVATVAATKPAAAQGKRKLSPEGRKAIADAMKRRWAEKRKQAAK